MNIHIGAQAVFVPGDDAWPLHNWEDITVNPNTPLENPYRILSDRVYQTAHNSGIRTLLSGIFGDNLYGGTEYWLLDLLAERRFIEAAWNVLKHVPNQGLREVINSRSFRIVGGRILDTIPGGRTIHPVRPITTPEWLTPQAAARINSSEVWPPNAGKARRPGQYQNLLGTYLPQGVTAEMYHTSRAGVEMRYPYRDLQLVQFLLSIPAHQLYNKGWYKYILRKAMQGILPEKVRVREIPTSVKTLFNRGLAEKEQSTVISILYGSDATWSDYVKPSWIQARLPGEILKDIQGMEQIVIWKCISIEIWRKSLSYRQLEQNSL
jgi:asparagine synthase (glutamine-hydrolysing)